MKEKSSDRSGNRVTEADTQHRPKGQYGKLGPRSGAEIEETLRLDDPEGRAAALPRSPENSSPGRVWPARDKHVAQQQQQQASAGYVQAAVPRAAVAKAPASTTAQAANANAAHEPVVGWLVVIDGPGRGNSREIRPGQNMIGSDVQQRISLDFGDPELAVVKHACIVFDPKSKRFFLQNGDSVKLTYLNDDVLLSPVQLSGGETFVLGNTKLKFVPLCGADFSWSEK